MQNLQLELIEIITHAPDVKTFRFELPESVSFKAGQYLVLTLPINGKDIAKPFSISNSPTEKGYVEFTKKLSGSDFSKALNKLEIGKAYALRMPLGKFTLEGKFEKCTFLSGGIGISPIRSIFKYATDKKLVCSLILLYSSRTPEYLIFRNDFAMMQKENRNIKVVYTLTHCDEKVSGCKIGRIDERMIKEEIPDYPERRFFICGPPAMVADMRSTLVDKLAVLPTAIITEDFIGY